MAITFRQPVTALAPQQVVGVLPGRQHREPGRFAGLQLRQQTLKRARLCALTGGVTVETQHRFIMKLPELPDLLFGQGGAERCDGCRNATLLDGNDIHISFGHEQRQIAPQPLARLHPAIQDRSSLKRSDPHRN